MGYTTDFSGSLDLSPALSPAQVAYLNLLFTTRRMKRNVNKLMELHNGEHGNPFATKKTPEAIYGREGEYFAYDDGQMGQGRDESIIEYNIPPMQSGFMRDTKDAVPGLWCQWEISEDGTTLEWDGGEKFYNYIDWLEYIFTHFFNPWGIKANGEIRWYGEDRDDIGIIKVTDNVVKTFVGKVSYEE